MKAVIQTNTGSIVIKGEKLSIVSNNLFNTDEISVYDGERKIFYAKKSEIIMAFVDEEME